MKKKTAYYAHSMRIYNSQREKEEFEFIKTRFNGKVICPNKELGELGNIDEYLKVVKGCSVLYISEYKEFIGKGVFLECRCAMENEIPIYLIRKDVGNELFTQKVKEIERSCYSDFIRFGTVIT